MGHLKRHESIAVLSVLGFENRAHAAAAQDLADPKAAVQQVSRLEWGTRRVNRIVVLRDFPAAGYLIQRTALGRFHDSILAQGLRAG
jgi:hypothetical protein